ncbi:hypothetical protein LEP1GSC020_3272 [Leptospira interrogans serovar Grippotyphosa str. 2006006986]|uniref:Uncharacterized protein n=1 Tax=Leptospira interrogans str. FPW1039 TaxID=1193040 RepID=A0A0F6I7G4_LEPIR|nr:hypothetical protein LEP1GSC009_4238 [Leptospira interrogans serovar Grippotyphosa str. Andaman]EKP83564.1 hypothetical protein LEP1GSC020_3272 [Leptospira interrogans serovar Grippotyphosa str. 2006006986]EMJ33989.1 hypothetical protein LEP1GSC079_1475 [Leptospira interrogans str. FPW1039]EMN73279.1 hypothetical protein LEP1GSC100_0863 [Leptospira interrogans serovar Bataviae str. UI 08561]EMN80479.1 hypothetical protein LEP1GSC106_0849 [Leptospira interrogans serovar Grippotyphosa str. UI 
MQSETHSDMYIFSYFIRRKTKSFLEKLISGKVSQILF